MQFGTDILLVGHIFRGSWEEYINWYFLNEGGYQEVSITHILPAVKESDSVDVSESHFISSTN